MYSVLPPLVPLASSFAFTSAVSSNFGKNDDANDLSRDMMAIISRDKSFASSFLPKFELTAEVNAKDDASGTRGGKTEYIGKVEMTWPLELFGTQFNSHRAALLRGNAAEINYAKSVKGL